MVSAVKKHILVFLFSVASAGAASASALVLDDFLNAAMENNFEVRIAAQSAESAQGGVQEAWGAFFPRLSASYNQSYMNRPVEMEFSMPVPLPGGGVAYETFSMPMGQKDNYQGRLSLEAPIFTFGVLRNRHKLAGSAYMIEREKQKIANQRALAGVRKAFYGYVLARELDAIARLQEEKFYENLRTTRRLYDRGAASSLDVSRVRLQLAGARSAAIDSSYDLALARDHLFSTSGITDSGQEVSGGLDASGIGFSYDELLEEALSRRPEIAIASLAVEARETSRRLERSVNLPGIYGYAGYVYERPYLNTDEWGNFWTMGVTVEFPFMDGLSVFGRERRTRADVRTSEVESERVREGVRLQVRSGYAQAMKAREKIDVHRENLALAEDNLKVSDERYAAGLLSNIEYNQAVLDYTSARVQYALAKADFLSALEDLRLAVGKELTFR